MLRITVPYSAIPAWFAIGTPASAAMPVRSRTHFPIPVSRSAARALRSRVAPVLLVALALLGGPAAAQAPGTPGCGCDGGAAPGPFGPGTTTGIGAGGADSAGSRGSGRTAPWWLPFVALPFLGGASDWSAGASPVPAPRAGSASAPSSDRSAPRLLAGPSRQLALVAPNTATARPAILLAGAALLLLAGAARRGRRRPIAVPPRPASATPRVLFAPAPAPSRREELADRWRASATGALATAGIGCFAVAGLGYTRGAVAAWEVRRNWERPSVEAARVAPGSLEIAAVARLDVPAIGLTRLVGEGVDDRTLAGGPGHMPATVEPGRTGLSVISAHRDLDFRRLGDVRLGDTVVTTTRTRRTVWRVVERAVVPKDSAALVPAAGRARLALTTCWPIRYIGPAPERLLLFADSVRSEPAPREPVRVAAR